LVSYSLPYGFASEAAAARVSRGDELASCQKRERLAASDTVIMIRHLADCSLNWEKLRDFYGGEVLFQRLIPLTNMKPKSPTTAIRISVEELLPSSELVVLPTVEVPGGVKLWLPAGCW
jgi:hypothetical protein